jgi:hypothetical protein
VHLKRGSISVHTEPRAVHTSKLYFCLYLRVSLLFRLAWVAKSAEGQNWTSIVRLRVRAFATEIYILRVASPSSDTGRRGT